jgi:[histone H3]-trimethyl-L-lysine4 demethylase
MGMLFSTFCWHREDINLASINYMHCGESKQWYGIPGSKAKAFRRVMEKQMKLRLKEVPDLEHHITTQISPSTLLSNSVPVYKTRQQAGEFIVTFPESYHCGFSYGFNCAEAVNFATSDWIPHGSQSVVDYRLKGKKEVFSFDRLVFTLTYHLKELSVESCKMLLNELQILLADETHYRKTLYSTGVHDVSKIAQLPNEGRMSFEIPEELANYDDQRVCSTCAHTCFLSAVCCNCRWEWDRSVGRGGGDNLLQRVL